MEKTKKVIIVSDVHGRTFWKNDVLLDGLDKDDTQIVFLGDYLDHYGFEGITIYDSLSNFYEIIDLRKNHSNVTLLLGNHDIHYYPPMHGDWGCRRYDDCLPQVSNLFVDYNDLFKIAHEVKGGEKTYLFTHAGVLDGWLKRSNGRKDMEGRNLDLSAESLNTLSPLRDEDVNILWDVSEERGGNARYGSCVWADVCEHMYGDANKNKEVYQIFGHSLSYPTIYDPVIEDTFAMLDCRKIFVLDTESGLLEGV